MSFICHIHNYTEYNQQWNVFSAFNPSKCTHTWSSGQPTLWRPGSSWGFSALLKGLKSVVDNFCRSRDLNPQPQVTSPTLYPLEPRLPTLMDKYFSGNAFKFLIFFNLYQKNFESRWLSREKWITLVLCCDWLLATDVTYSCARTPLTQDQAWVDRESW